MTGERISFAAGVDREAAAAQAAAVLLRDGVVVLDGLADPALVERCRDEIERAYPDMTHVDRERNFGPYDKRHTVPVRVERTLADRAIFVPPAVAKVAERVLGESFHLESLGLLVSAPGAPDQPGHPDGSLFPEKGIDRVVPPFALAFSLPLVPMDAVSGATAFWRGSHRKPDVTGEHDFAPVVLPGSGVLWDFRTIHRGLANRGTRPRPVIFSVFCREWWREITPRGATRYERLLIAREVYDSLKPRMQRMVSRARIVEGTRMEGVYADD